MNRGPSPRAAFLVSLGAAVAGGVLVPEGGRLLREAKLVLPVLTAATLFVSGTTLRTETLRAAGSTLRALVLGVTTTFLVAPMAAYGLARLFGPDLETVEGRFFLEAVMLAAAQAGTIASATALTMIAGGDSGIAIALTVATNTLTVVLTPLALEASIGAIVEFPAREMMLRMATTVLLPMLAGQAFRRLVPGVASQAPLLVVVSQAIILVFVYTGVSAAAGRLGADPSMLLRFFVTSAALHLLLLGWIDRAAIFLALPPGARTALLFCGSQKTLPNGIYLWDRFFAANPHGALGLVVYHLFQLVVDTLLVPWARPRRPPAA